MKTVKLKIIREGVRLPEIFANDNYVVATKNDGEITVTAKFESTPKEGVMAYIKEALNDL